MKKYKGAILLPLTLNDTGCNPIAYPFMTFNSDPNLKKGDRRTLRYQEQELYIDFDALLVASSEYQEDNFFIVMYVFEPQDRTLALRIANIVKNTNPGMFKEDNLSI
jgi:hypothetical protein